MIFALLLSFEVSLLVWLCCKIQGGKADSTALWHAGDVLAPIVGALVLWPVVYLSMPDMMLARSVRRIVPYWYFLMLVYWAMSVWAQSSLKTPRRLRAPKDRLYAFP